METLRILIAFMICSVKCKVVDKNKHALEILDALKRYGYRSEVNTSKTQYVSVTVLSQTEFDDLKWLENKQFPDRFRIKNEERVIVQYNENNNADHGEKLFLNRYLKGLTVEMKKYCKLVKSANCSVVVVLFSWYIPCSLVKHTCAEKLTTIPTSNQIFVGFSEIYPNYRNGWQITLNNVKQSFKILVSSDNILVYYIIKYYSGKVPIKYSKPIEELPYIFETNMFECIIQTPVSFCCGSNYNKNNPEETNLASVDKVTALSVNCMINSCLYKPLVENDTLKDCFLRWTVANIGVDKDCKKCWNTNKKTYRYIVDSCIKFAYVTSEYIVEQAGYNADDPTKWTLSILGKDMSGYKLDEISLNLVKCYKSKLDPRTFCTKESVREQNPYKYKYKETCKSNRVKKIKKQQTIYKFQKLRRLKKSQS